MSQTILTVTGENEASEVVIDPKGVLVGRNEQCDIVLDNEKISRRHARIFRDPFDRWLIQDLDSRNGIKVNGRRVDVHAMLPGESVTLGPFALTIGRDKDVQMELDNSAGSSRAMITDDPATQVVYADKQTDIRLSRGRLKWLNAIADRLSGLTKASLLYQELCCSVARVPGSAAVVLRLSRNEDLPQVLACHIGGTPRYTSDNPASAVPLSRRVVQAVASRREPVMAANSPDTSGEMMLTITDETRPRTVYCCPLGDSGDVTDALYVDLPSDQAMGDGFDFFQAVARQVSLARKSLLLAEARARQEVLDRQLEMGRSIQAKLLPDQLDNITDVDIAVRCEPAMWVGGDYCDVWRLSDGRVAFAVGDVCGKGLPAAMLMASLQAALRSTTAFCSELGQVVRQVARLITDNMPEGMFITLFIGILDPQTGQLHYVNSGHLQPLIVTPEGELSQLGRPSNFPIGIADVPIRAECETLAAGIGLVVVTDGITESVSPGGELFGLVRLKAAIKACSAVTAAEVVGRLVQDADDFRASCPQGDDVTVLCLVTAPGDQTEGE